ncbi:unnamed protein product [Acanthoscelides obtectus]|uniref:Uncharacterized protein n=1 Tax=Acanthoscelides obtectus TaxID=200917 RepID=A0A9P0LSD1_ACAOB|nr:unnamed protein product [Acanthoscelides obtectus]CAK1672298.1 hypothetical protein AOBTE_LOCUS28764 [Acanthoscelides obtectus]
MVNLYVFHNLMTIAERVAQLLARKYETRLREQELAIVELKEEIRDLRDTQDRILRTVDDQEQANLNVNVFGLPVENRENLHKKAGCRRRGSLALRKHSQRRLDFYREQIDGGLSFTLIIIS